MQQHFDLSEAFENPGLPSRNSASCWLAEPVLTTVATGHETQGNLFLLRQIHTTYSESQDELEHIGRYQEKILEFLASARLQHVFVESLTRDFPALPGGQNASFCHYHYWLLPPALRARMSEATLLSDLQALFQDYGKNGACTRDQALFLGALGGAVIHAIIDPDVSLHSTISPEDEARITALQARLIPGSPRFALLRDGIREHRALLKVKCFLTDNPGAEAALVYGAWHEFGGHAQRMWAAPPQITALDWRPAAPM